MSALALFADLTDAALLERLGKLAREERRATAQLVAALAELERRRLYLAQGCSSLFTYCTKVLHLSEHAAYNRIEAARAAMRFPAILERLEDGSVTLTAVRLLAPLLTTENHGHVLAEACHKGKKQMDVLVAGLRPLPDAPAIVRRLPTAAAQSHAVLTTDATATTHPAAVLMARTPIEATTTPRPPSATATPLTRERYKIQFTASREFHDKLRRAQAWLRHAVPTGDPAEILERALDLLLADVERRKLGMTERPRTPRDLRTGSRHIPAAVKREVWKRDAGRCAFVGTAGRCGEEAFLEFHHVVPFAEGGPATTRNIQLRCRAHNVYEAEQCFGRMFPRDAEGD